MKTNVIAVIDFETTGLSPRQGARAIEIAAVLVSGGRVIDSFASLMNPGVAIPSEITHLTGITTPMVQGAPPARSVMQDVTRFIGDADLVAHNASFDQRFLEAEQHRIGCSKPRTFICTMLLSRRLFRDAPNHRLGTLIRHLSLPVEGSLHRALADARVTTELLFRIQSAISARCGHTLAHSALTRLQRTPKQDVDRVMMALAQSATCGDAS